MKNPKAKTTGMVGTLGVFFSSLGNLGVGGEFERFKGLGDCSWLCPFATDIFYLLTGADDLCITHPLGLLKSQMSYTIKHLVS